MPTYPWACSPQSHSLGCHAHVPVGMRLRTDPKFAFISPVQTASENLHHKQCHRENLPGQAHFLTFSCFQRRPFLAKDRTRNWLIESIAAATVKHHLDLWAYVIMPEHVHLIIFPRKEV